MSSKNNVGGCCGTEFGCCPDGKTAKVDSFGSNCSCRCWKHPSSLPCPPPIPCKVGGNTECCKKKCRTNKYNDCKEDNNNGNLMQVISAQDNLSVFNIALNMTDLPALLSSNNNFTVFAPDNQAFEEIEDLDSILDNEELLNSILKLHIVEGVFKSNQIPPGKTNIKTLNGQDIIINNTNNSITVANDNESVIATVIEPDLLASNGVIHVINKVLLPTDNNSENVGGGKPNNQTFFNDFYQNNNY